MRYNYPAFIIKDDGKYTVTFPDVPGCLTFADSTSEAFVSAQEALETHLSAMKDEGMVIPQPSDLLNVNPDEDDDVVERILVPVAMDGPTVRTNITIDQNLLDLIDNITPNRSLFFAEAARHELVRRRN
jgi:predicted RNase H-like HicB family nuclease